MGENWVKWYREQGINIIPLREGEKVSLLKWDEFQRRSTTDEEAKGWLSSGIKNFGAICGSVSSNLLVIDVDEKELFSELDLGKLASETFTVKTGKGYHIYLRMPDPGKKNLVWKRQEEIRFQGEGKYVVCAGSIHPSGEIYEPLITSPKEIKRADPQLLDEIERRWKEYHGIDKLEKKREEVKSKTKRAGSIEDFKRRVSLTDVVTRYVSKINDYGTYWQGHCPFHHDRTPSFTVYEDTKTYHCFGCERHGDVITFIEEKEGKSFFDAITRIMEITGVEYFISKKGKDEEEGKIYPSIVEEIIRAERRFATLRDTEEVLHYENTRGGAWRFDGEAIIKEETEKILEELAKREKTTRYFVNEVIGHVQRRTYIDRERFNTEKNKINLLNGVYDLETEQLLPHDLGYYFMYLIPVKYNHEADCPKIKKFLEDILHEDDIKIVLQFIGYCMLPIMPYHKAMIFLGEGANGKSTLIELIRHFLGEKNTSSHSLQSIIEERFTKGYMYGQLANLYADIPKDALRHTSVFKVLTGGDTLSAEKKFKEPFSFKNTAKLIFSANDLPRTLDDTDAFFRRWLIINFPNKFEGEQSDPKILEKLTTPEELSGFLNIILGELKQLLIDGRFYGSKPAAEIREEWIDKSDPIMSFAMRRLEPDRSAFEKKDDVYLAFVNFCKERKLPEVDKIKFGTYLPKYVSVKVERKRISGTRFQCWSGIRLKEEESLYTQNHESQQKLKEENIGNKSQGNDSFVCERCGKVKEPHERHLLRSKDNEMVYVCDACLKLLPSEPEKRYICEECSMKFSSQSEIVEHKKDCDAFQELQAREASERKRGKIVRQV